jgi:hypothetical protein
MEDEKAVGQAFFSFAPEQLLAHPPSPPGTSDFERSLSSSYSYSDTLIK